MKKKRIKQPIVPVVFKDIFTTKKKYIILRSGRDAGKSTILAMKVTQNFFEYDLDIVIMRANSSDMRKSVFSAIVKQITALGMKHLITTYTRPVRIVNNLNGNQILFEGIGGSDLSRTRSAEPDKELSMIMIEETQQLQSQSNLDQALATYRRHLNNEVGQIMMAFNPEPQNSHWMNEYFRINSENPYYLCISSSYKDIATLLTDFDKQAIQMEKKINPSNYRYMYLGETNGLFGGVYHTFNRDWHLIDDKTVNKLIKDIGIHQILVGVDGATTRDSTAMIPVAILNNGQGIVLETFHHNPIKNGALSNDRLFPYLMKHIEMIENQYDLRFKGTPITFVIDSASADLVVKMTYDLPKRYKVFSYSQKKIVQMAQVMQNAFSRNVLYIKDTNGIYNYITGRFENGNFPLITQLESVIWDEKGKGFDPLVPNDDTDALTYAVAFYFINPHNMYFPPRANFYEKLKVEKKEVNS